MAAESVSQSRPGAPPGVHLTQEEWSEFLDIDMAFHAALRCDDADDPHKIELLKCVQARYTRFVADIDSRLDPA